MYLYSGFMDFSWFSLFGAWDLQSSTAIRGPFACGSSTKGISIAWFTMLDSLTGPISSLRRLSLPEFTFEDSEIERGVVRPLKVIAGEVLQQIWNGLDHISLWLEDANEVWRDGVGFIRPDCLHCHYRNCPIQYQAAVSELLETAVQVFSHKILKYGERSGLEGMHDQICELICDLQIAAVDSNQSLRRVALGPNDHFFLPSSAEHQTEGQYGSLQEDRKERSSRSPSPPRINGHSVLGQVLFDACVPKNIEGWDIKFSGSLNGQPLASVRKNSPLSALKGIRRSRL